jgi:hypothetical protein
MARKINIFKNGEYLCSSTQRKTCKEAVEKFKENPTYQGYTYGLGMTEITVDVECNKITANFAD